MSWSVGPNSGFTRQRCAPTILATYYRLYWQDSHILCWGQQWNRRESSNKHIKARARTCANTLETWASHWSLVWNILRQISNSHVIRVRIWDGTRQRGFATSILAWHSHPRAASSSSQVHNTFKTNNSGWRYSAIRLDRNRNTHTHHMHYTCKQFRMLAVHVLLLSRWSALW